MHKIPKSLTEQTFVNCDASPGPGYMQWLSLIIAVVLNWPTLFLVLSLVTLPTNEQRAYPMLVVLMPKDMEAKCGKFRALL